MGLSFLRRPNLELVSIHIPKTAGTSFRKILEDLYGETRVVRVDIPLPGERPHKQLPTPPRLPREVKVIHGHFCYLDLARNYRLDKSTPVITWVRDPVERVISNYFYLQKILRQILREEQRSVNILSRMERSLIEYSCVEINRNRMFRFLKGFRLQDFFFVGIQEHFSDDLSFLVQTLGFRNPVEYKHNQSFEQRSEVSQQIREEIRRLNHKDEAIYREALHLRKLRTHMTRHV